VTRPPHRTVPHDTVLPNPFFFSPFFIVPPYEWGFPSAVKAFPPTIPSSFFPFFPAPNPTYPPADPPGPLRVPTIACNFCRPCPSVFRFSQKLHLYQSGATKTPPRPCFFPQSPFYHFKCVRYLLNARTTPANITPYVWTFGVPKILSFNDPKNPQPTMTQCERHQRENIPLCDSDTTPQPLSRFVSCVSSSGPPPAYFRLIFLFFLF